MATTDLNRLLNSVGKSIFIQFYEDFRNSALSPEEIIDRLPKHYTLKSRQSRTSHAQRIFREGLEAEALSIIANSAKMDAEIINVANILLTQILKAKT